MGGWTVRRAYSRFSVTSIFCKKRIVAPWTLAILLGLTSVAALARQAKTTDKRERSKAVPPSGPEMERLKFYLGDWDYTEKYEKTAFYPHGGTNTGVYSSKQGPGGNSLVQNFHSQGPVGDFEGLIVMTWDPGAKQYKGYVFGNAFPGCVVQSGQFENEVLVFRSEFSAGPTKVSLRGTTRLSSPGKTDSEEYISTNGGPEVLMLRVEAKKR